MVTIGVSLIAHNEASTIAGAIISAQFADDIVVVDCGSTDETSQIAAQFSKVKVFSRPNDSNLNRNKSFGFQQLNTDWIFYLDPDERIPESLIPHIRAAITDCRSHNAYRIPRKNHFFGRWLKYGGQYPDFQTRLFRNGFAEFPNKHVHESLKVNGTIGSLAEPFDHFPYPDLSTYLKKMDFYTSFQANFWLESKETDRWWLRINTLALSPINRFLRRYVLKRGFLDGWPGYIAALGDAFQIAVSYAKFLEINSTKL